MARKATAAQKAAARKLGIRVTKTVRGKRVELSSAQLKAKIAAAKAKKERKKIASKRKAKSKRQISPNTSTSRAADKKIKAKPAGKRKSTKTSLIKYKVKDPKTGKMVWKTRRRKNANQHVKSGKAGGRTYTERRSNRSDKGKFL